MKLLLDTHIWLWSIGDTSRLSPRVAKALKDPTSELWLSPISIWEFILLCEKGRIEMDEDPSSWVALTLENIPMKEAPFTADVALRLSRLELSHQDPADRFIVATAQAYGLTLVTADRRLTTCNQVSILSNN